MSNWQATPAEREGFVTDLLAAMTLEEKLGQLALQQPATAPGIEADIAAGAVGGVVGAHIDAARLQGLATGRSRMGIPLLIMPEESGASWSPWALAAGWDEGLCRLAGAFVSAQTRHSGANTVEAPRVAAGHGPTGRRAQLATPEPVLLTRLSSAFVAGIRRGGEPGEQVLPIPRWIAGSPAAEREWSARMALADHAIDHASAAGSFEESRIEPDVLFAECKRLSSIIASRYARTSCRSLREAAQRAIEEGELTLGQIDAAVRGVLTIKHALDLFPFPDRLVSNEAGELQRSFQHALRRSVVLLRNDGGVLPLSPVSDRILLVGTADGASAACAEALSRSGIGHTVAPGLAVRTHMSDWADVVPGDHFAISLTRDAAKRTDFVLVVLDDRHFAQRSQMQWPQPTDAALLLVDALATLDVPRVAILSTRQPVDLGPIDRHFAAALQCWAGEANRLEDALGDILVGRAAPEGRMPANAGLYSLGHGLGYSDTVFSKLQVVREGDCLRAHLRVRNLGYRPVREVVQLYGRLENGLPRLLDFAAIGLTPGEDGPVSFEVPLKGEGWEIGVGHSLSRTRFVPVPIAGEGLVVAGRAARR